MGVCLVINGVYFKSEKGKWVLACVGVLVRDFIVGSLF